VEIKPLRSEDDYQSALAEIGRLWGAEPGTSEFDELDILTMLVERYEEEHYPIDAPDPIAAIKFRMEQQGLKRKDLEPYIGSRARVSEVMAGSRSLSVDMIRKLHEGLGIPAEVLIKKIEIKGKKTPTQPSKKTVRSAPKPGSKRQPARRSQRVRGSSEGRESRP